MEVPVTSAAMRVYCQRPGKMDEEGKPVYFTEQNHKNQCDINKIIQKYDKTGLIIHVSKIEAKYGDMTGLDYRTMVDKVMNMEKSWMELPSKVRKRFGGNIGDFLEFMENPDNRDEAISLGLIKASTPADKDGLGEHVKPEEVPA